MLSKMPTKGTLQASGIIHFIVLRGMTIVIKETHDESLDNGSRKERVQYRI